MGLFDNLINLAESPAGQSAMGQLAQHLPDVLSQHGINGTQGLVEKLEQGGLGQAVASWMSDGPNQKVTAEQIEQTLGTSMVNSLAQKFGIDPTKANQFVADNLPQIIAALHGGQPT
ncbi:hypothetical protein LMIY3S_02925 [Labrys miyagiensis]